VLHCDFSGVQQDFGGDVPWSLFIDELVDLLTLIQEELWLDIAQPSKVLLLTLLVDHVFKALMGYMNLFAVNFRLVLGTA